MKEPSLPENRSRDDTETRPQFTKCTASDKGFWNTSSPFISLPWLLRKQAPKSTLHFRPDADPVPTGRCAKETLLHLKFHLNATRLLQILSCPGSGFPVCGLASLMAMNQSAQ